MNYENKSENLNQEIKIKDRKKVELTGVKKIESLNDKEFVIDTNLGRLRVLGSTLEMKQLEIEKGLLVIIGTIDSVSYEVNGQAKEKKQNFLGKIFK